VPDVAETSGRALPPDIRRRLEQFLQRLDRLRVEDLPMFATRPIDQAAYDESVRAAAHAAFDSGRRTMLDQIHRDATAWLNRLFSRHQFYPEWAGGHIGLTPGTARDAVRLREALTGCLSALVLWDVLDDVYRGHLIGAWAALLEDES
jgi:hypothetical protein